MAYKKNLIDTALSITTDLLKIKGTFNTESVDFKLVLACIFRRSRSKLYAIKVLSESPRTGDSIMGITRCIIDEFISVYFMKLKGKQKMAQKIVDYAYVEKKLEQDWLISMHQKLNKALVKQANIDYDKVKNKFMRKSGEVSRSWANCSTEEMMKELVKNKAISSGDYDLLSQSYVLGNKKIHLSAFDLVSYFNPKIRNSNLSINKDLGVMIALICFISIAIELSNEIGDTKLSKRLEDLKRKVSK